MEARRDIFQAIADPTRREIIDLLSSKPLNLNSIAQHFSVSRPAISQHIKVLIECGVVSAKQQGRERFCDVNLATLHEVSAWVEQYRKFWTAKLDDLERFLDKKHGAGQKKKTNRKTKS